MPASAFASLGQFVTEDIVDGFIQSSYTPTDASVMELCKLMGVCKVFRTAVKRQLADERGWLRLLKCESVAFESNVPQMLQNGEYDVFFDGLRRFRILPNATFHHLAFKALIEHTLATPGENRASAVVSVMRYHRHNLNVRRFGCGLLLRLQEQEIVPQGEVMREAAVIVDAMAESPSEANLQNHGVRCLARMIHQMVVVPPMLTQETMCEKLCYTEGYDVIALILWGMSRNRNQEAWQDQVMFFLLRLAPYWRFDPAAAALLPPTSTCAAVYKVGVDKCVLQTMQIFKDNTAIQENACLFLAELALHNLVHLTNPRTVVATITSAMIMNGVSTAHSVAMVSATALCVDRFSYDHKLKTRNAIHQDMFVTGGTMALLLSALHDYTRGRVFWSARVLHNVIGALDSLCIDNIENTLRFARANGMPIVVKAFFRAPLQLKSMGSCAIFALFEHIVAAIVPRDDNDHTDKGAIRCLLPLLSKKFYTEVGGGAHKTQHSLVEIVLIVIRDNTQQQLNDDLVQRALRILCSCMQQKTGVEQVVLHGGIADVLALMNSDWKRRNKHPEMRAGCLKVLATAASKYTLLPLHDGLLEFAFTTTCPPWLKSPDYDDDLHRLRTAVVRIQARECIDLILAAPKLVAGGDRIVLTEIVKIQDTTLLCAQPHDAAVAMQECLPGDARQVATCPRDF